MLILVPWKPVVLTWVMLSGLVLVGYARSSMLEGKYPSPIDIGNSPGRAAKRAVYSTHPGLTNPLKGQRQPKESQSLELRDRWMSK